MKRFYYTYFRHTRKNSHLSYFLRSIIRYIMPQWYLNLRVRAIRRRYSRMTEEERKYVDDRVDYYCKFCDSILLPDDAPQLSGFTYKQRESYVHDYVNSTYFFDAYEYIRFYPKHLRWAYNPGDVNYLFPVPEITKSRPVASPPAEEPEMPLPVGESAIPSQTNRNNILLNLDKVRHFTWITDPFSWEEKECRILFRGDASNKPRRLRFIEMWKDHPWCDLVSTGNMSLYDHLSYRYIMALEGNDVASNLKWVMSSNSAAVMPRPTCETWFMEERLIPGYHYIEIAADYHDLIDKISYYEAHPGEAKEIVEHAHQWCKQFHDKKREDLISVRVLDKYFHLTGQSIS